jgi:hypothetical protein
LRSRWFVVINKKTPDAAARIVGIDRTRSIMVVSGIGFVGIVNVARSEATRHSESKRMNDSCPE